MKQKFKIGDVITHKESGGLGVVIEVCDSLVAAVFGIGRIYHMKQTELNKVKNKTALAPAVFRWDPTDEYFITDSIFRGAEQAEGLAKNCGHKFVKWPVNNSSWVIVDK